MIELRHFATAPLSACLILAVCTGVCVAQSKEKAHAKPALAPTQCDRSAFRVVLDVGHTLDVPGAMSARGIPEYAFNLQLAQDANKALTDAGFDKTVLMITDKPPPHSLVERAMRANTSARRPVPRYPSRLSAG